MIARQLFFGFSALAATIAAVGCGGSADVGSGSPDYDAALRGSPPKLAAIHDQADELLDGGADAFEARIADLHGYPVVVNKWASWCAPCKLEFPYFQSQAAKHGTRIAFLGVNSNDGEQTAADFLAQRPVPYPSYLDPQLDVAAVFDAPTEFPATAFYDSEAKLVYVKRGAYADEQELAADIERYAH